MGTTSPNIHYSSIRPTPHTTVDFRWFYDSYTFSFEKNFDGINEVDLFRRRYWLPSIVACIYIALTFAGQRYMKNRQPIKIFDKLLVHWNWALTLFSFIGSTRILPYAFYLLYKLGIDNSSCVPPQFTYGYGVSGLWTVLFALSKYVELFDTAFLVFRNRPVSFLHWYHHATVLVFTMDAYVTVSPLGIYFAAMNYFVHTIMYYYFYKQALKQTLNWGRYITYAQITQMLLGLLLTINYYRLTLKRPPMTLDTLADGYSPSPSTTCYYCNKHLLYSGIIYSSYFILFVHFYVKRYIKNSTNNRSKTIKVK